MGRSPLLGTERAATEAPGHDTAALGPGDNSDSGSDLAGIADSDIGDPTAPVDIAMRDDYPHSLMPSETAYGGTSDSGGTGERRSAGGDAGLREAADIGVDRVFTPGVDEDPLADELSDDGLSDDEDADLAFVDEAQAGDPVEDEDEDEIELAEADATEDALREGGGGEPRGEDDAYDAAVKIDEDGTTEDDLEVDAEDEDEDEEDVEGEGLGNEDDGIPKSSGRVSARSSARSRSSN